jgi:hypothetical protein
MFLKEYLFKELRYEKDFNMSYNDRGNTIS